MICTNCYFRGESETKIRGNFLIEIILWFFFLIPGLVYTIWRQTTKVKACPHCGQQNLIPEDSIRGKELIKSYPMTDESKKIIEDVHKKNKSKKTKKTIKIAIVAFILLLFIGWLADGVEKDTDRLAQTPESHITEADKRSLADAFCRERSKEYVNSVDFNDFIKLSESDSTVTLHQEAGKPTSLNCEKVANICTNNWSLEDCQRAAERKIWIGMDENLLYLSWGVPQDKNNTINDSGVRSQWVYGDFGPYVYLEGKNNEPLMVTSWQD